MEVIDSDCAIIIRGDECAVLVGNVGELRWLCDEN